MTGRAAALVAALLGLGLGPAGTAAAQAGDCLSEVRLEGPGAARSALLAELQPGLLSGTPTGPCTGARVAIAPDGEGYWLRLEQGDRAIERHAATVEAAAVWVESWLAPAYASDPESANDAAAAQALAAVAEAPAPHLPAATVHAAAGPSEDNGDGAQPPEGPTDREPPSVVLQTSYVWSFDHERQFWVGPAIDLHFPVGRSMWLGLAFQTNFQVGEARAMSLPGTDRRWACIHQAHCSDAEAYNLIASARFGGRLTRGRFFLRGGLGIGFAGGNSSVRVRPRDSMATVLGEEGNQLSRVGDDELGPVAELFAEVGVRLGQSGLHLVFGMTGRWFNNEGRDWTDAGTVTPCEEVVIPGTAPPQTYPRQCQVLPPNPIPRYMFDARVGLAWAFGGDR